MKKLADRLWGDGRLRDFLSAALLFCLLVGLDATLRYVYDGVGITRFGDGRPWLFTLSWALLLPLSLRMLPQKLRRALTAAVVLLYGVLFLTHAMMYSAKMNFFRFSLLMFAGDGLKFLDASYLHVRKLIWFAFFCALVSGGLSVALVPAGKRGRRALSLILIPFCIAAINLNSSELLSGRVAVHVEMLQSSLIYEDFTNPLEALPLAGLYQYTFRDFCVSYGVYDFFSRAGNAETVAALDAWYAAKTPDPDNAWTGRFAGKNLILIQLEATDTWMIREDFMPNLYAIEQKSLDFTRHYTPVYFDAGTFNTEMIVNTGLVSPFSGSRSSMYSRNAYPDSLAHLLTAEGYTARSFHRSDGYVYNRAKVHENLGYEHYYSGAEIGMLYPDFDEDLMYAYGRMTEKEPFFTFIITYSPHGPYVDGLLSGAYYDWVAEQLPADTDPMLIHAYARAHEEDLFIGALLERLEADGLLDDTVLVFYADHYNYYTQSKKLVMEQKRVRDKNLITNTPFFIYEAHTAPQKIDKVLGSFDVLPTLVNLFGLDDDGTHYVGNDAFSPNGGYVIFADYSWFDGETYWRALGGEPPTEAVLARNEELRTRLEMSWDTMRLNYFAK